MTRGQPDVPPSADAVIERAGEQVERYFARAQSLVCLEIVRLQPLTANWSHDGLGRTVESELRLSWEAAQDGSSLIEAKTLRQVLRVNGGKPRANDRNNCTTPEQEDEEQPPLSMLLPHERREYRFTGRWSAGTRRSASRRCRSATRTKRWSFRCPRPPSRSQSDREHRD